MLGRSRLEEALQILGARLLARGMEYDLVAIGGGSLLLRQLGIRPTQDLDVIAVVEAGEWHKADPLPAPLAEEVSLVAEAMGLDPNWLNSAAASVMDNGLPEGFRDRVEVQNYGGLTLRVAGRFDQICFKLHAAVDRGELQGKHIDDLRALRPPPEDLIAAARWATTHDPSEGFRSHLILLLAILGVPNAEQQL
jgi:hypothetical protein